MDTFVIRGAGLILELSTTPNGHPIQVEIALSNQSVKLQHIRDGNNLSRLYGVIW